MPSYRHTASGLLDGSYPWSFGWYSNATITESAAEANWASGVGAMWGNASFASMFSTGVTCNLTKTSTLDANWHQVTATQTTHAFAGTATQSLPYHTAVVVTFATGGANKSSHGRWYLPPPASAALATAGFHLSTTAVTDLVAGVNALLTACIGTLTPVLLHRRGNKSGTITPLSFSNFNGGSIGDGFDVQSRRADKRVETRTNLTW